ncbi:MAG: DUF459 domain-containing protein [Ilumatobacteraceae bacterium]
MVAVAAALLVVGGAVWAVTTIVGGDGEAVVSGSAPDTTPVDPTADTAPGTPAAPETAPGTVPATVAATVDAATTTTVAGPVAPTAQSPAKVLVVGDSDAGTFGPYLKQIVDGTGVAETTVDYKVSSGLARPDFFDWPAHLGEELPAADPDIVVVTFGGNDGQGLSTSAGENPQEWNDPVGKQETWTAEYSRRVGEMMDLLAADGRTVIWVGIPNDDNPEVTARMKVQDDAVRAALATHPDVQFVDTWARFSSGNGGWAEYVIDPRDGQGKDVRADDGFHLNQNGAEILALDIAEVVKSDLRTRGATI